jgi:hypothetical protein
MIYRDETNQINFVNDVIQTVATVPFDYSWYPAYNHIWQTVLQITNMAEQNYQQSLYPFFICGKRNSVDLINKLTAWNANESTINKETINVHNGISTAHFYPNCNLLKIIKTVFSSKSVTHNCVIKHLACDEM